MNRSDITGIVARIHANAAHELHLLEERSPELLKEGAILPFHYVGNTLKKICGPLPVLAGVYDSSPSRVFVDATDPVAAELIAALNKAVIKVAADTVEFTAMTDGERSVLGFDPSMKVPSAA